MKVAIILIIIDAFRTVTKVLLKGLENLEIEGWLETPPNYCIIEIGQNTEKNPGDLRGLAVPQTPVKDHQLKLMWKILKPSQQQLNNNDNNNNNSHLLYSSISFYLSHSFLYEPHTNTDHSLPPRSLSLSLSLYIYIYIIKCYWFLSVIDSSSVIFFRRLAGNFRPVALQVWSKRREKLE